MCRKSPAMAYYSHKIKITPRSVIIEELKEALPSKDLAFMMMILEGASYKEIAQAFQKSEARVYQWKREIFERMSLYDSNNLDLG